MKNTEIDILSKILTDFEEHLSQQERLLKEFRIILDNERCSRRIQGYQRDPEYYKRKVQA